MYRPWMYVIAKRFFSLAKIYKAYGMQYIFDIFVLIVLWNRHDVIESSVLYECDKQ